MTGHNGKKGHSNQIGQGIERKMTAAEIDDRQHQQ